VGNVRCNTSRLKLPANIFPVINRPEEIRRKYTGPLRPLLTEPSKRQGLICLGKIRSSLFSHGYIFYRLSSQPASRWEGRVGITHRRPHSHFIPSKHPSLDSVISTRKVHKNVWRAIRSTESPANLCSLGNYCRTRQGASRPQVQTHTATEEESSLMSPGLQAHPISISARSVVSYPKGEHRYGFAIRQSSKWASRCQARCVNLLYYALTDMIRK
jgi:hypothetical protein